MSQRNNNPDNKKRDLSHLLPEEDYDDPLPARKKRKIDNNHKSNEDNIINNTNTAMLTIQIHTGGYFGYSREPFWICGSSTNKTFAYDIDDDWHLLSDSDLDNMIELPPFAPVAFLSAFHYPFLRFCNIPVQELKRTSYNEYNYNHLLCTKYETDNSDEISNFINHHINKMHQKLNKNKKVTSWSYEAQNDLLSHLFIMKEYYKTYKNTFTELTTNSTSTLGLPTDIIQYTLSDFIYEIKAAQDSDYLNDNQRINQTKWFEYVFYYLEFLTTDWQMFFYDMLKHGAYNTLIINFMKRRKSLAFRQFKYSKLMIFSMQLYPYTFASTNIISFVSHAIKTKDCDLFVVALKLFDTIKPGAYFGKLLVSIVKHIELDDMALFNKVCVKIKGRCVGKEKILKYSFNKFNMHFSNGLKFNHWNESQLESIKMMQTVLNYDANTIVPLCCKNSNLGLIQSLIEEEFLDYNICKDNGYLDQLNELISFGRKKRNKRSINSEFEDIVNGFISKHSTKK